MNKKTASMSHLRQYVLTGAALGLYFGWFFRPLRDPSIVTILLLSTVITIVMTCIRMWRREWEQLAKRAASTWVNYALILAVLEARHFAFDLGGRPAVIVMTILFGALAGYRMATKPLDG